MCNFPISTSKLLIKSLLGCWLKFQVDESLELCIQRPSHPIVYSPLDQATVAFPWQLRVVTRLGGQQRRATS